jgi:hypothetical protein
VSYDLGSASYRFRDLYLSGSSIDLGGVSITSDGTNLALPPISNISGDFTVDTDTLHVDSANERVGIGTTSPSSELHIQKGAGSGTTFSSTHDLVVDSDSDAGIAIYTSNTSNGYLRFGDTDSNAAGGMDYDHATNDLNIRTSGATAMTIDSSGNVGIGTTSPSAELDIKGASNPEIRLQSTDSTDPFLYFGDQVDAVRGGIGMDTSANALQLRGYNNSTRMTIDSSGNVGINKTAPGVALDVVGSSTTGDSVLRVKSNDVRTNIVLQDTTTTSDILLSCYGNDFYVRTGGADRFHMDSSGHVRMPYQPCFYAYRSGSNPTHGAGWSVMSFNAELFDSNGDYNTSNYRFVAPVTGNYQFNTTINMYNVDVSQNATQFVISLYKNGVEQTRMYQGAQYTNAASDRNRSGSAVLRMNANDYAEIRVYSADTNYQLSAGQYWNSFSGFLIG